jgi:hypothetical protein
MVTNISLFLRYQYLFLKNTIMASGKKSSSSNSMKVTFGKKKTGKHTKSVNKHDRKVKKYKGQGR